MGAEFHQVYLPLEHFKELHPVAAREYEENHKKLHHADQPPGRKNNRKVEAAPQKSPKAHKRVDSETYCILPEAKAIKGRQIKKEGKAAVKPARNFIQENIKAVKAPRRARKRPHNYVERPPAKPITPPPEAKQRKLFNVDLQELPKMGRSRLEKIKVLGQGAFGKVWVVTDVHTQQQYAMKVIGSDKDLRHECAVMLRLARVIGPHKNLINIKAMTPGRSEGKYMIMELGKGSLSRLLKRDNIRGDQLRDDILEIINGAAAIEQAGLQHHDLKPDNILLGKDGHLKICDFGIADRKDKMVYAGTPYYLPPEKLGTISSTTPDKADSWALGLILAEMRLGRAVMETVLKPSRNGRGLSTPSRRELERALDRAHRDLRAKEGEEAADLFLQLTAINPDHRISPSEALHHPYFQD